MTKVNISFKEETAKLLHLTAEWNGFAHWLLWLSWRKPNPNYFTFENDFQSQTQTFLTILLQYRLTQTASTWSIRTWKCLIHMWQDGKRIHHPRFNQKHKEVWTDTLKRGGYLDSGQECANQQQDQHHKLKVHMYFTWQYYQVFHYLYFSFHRFKTKLKTTKNTIKWDSGVT